MKKLLSLAVILFMAATVRAQLNPMKGYIITSSGETVNGTIDFLSRSKLARECHFMADGQSDYKTYLPGEIQGFRLSGNGVYFVSRQFPVDGQQQTIFAEFIMQGGVSLYRYENTWTNAQYFLVDESGKVAVVRDPGDMSAYTQEDAQKRKQEFLQPALDSDFTLPANVSIYAGGGIEVKLGKHALQVLARYGIPICKTETYTKGLTATVGFMF